jgi:hypothetical protein
MTSVCFHNNRDYRVCASAPPEIDLQAGAHVLGSPNFFVAWNAVFSY